jgi:hypothetical protein
MSQKNASEPGPPSGVGICKPMGVLLSVSLFTAAAGVMLGSKLRLFPATVPVVAAWWDAGPAAGVGFGEWPHLAHLQ